jgi:threonyl-tRNA synthetase
MHACILNINDKVTDYCNEIYEKMTQAGIIAQLDMDNKPLQQKIAIHSLEKVPYLIIVGEKEKASKTVSIRIIDNGNNAISMPIDEFINIVVEKIKTKSLNFLLK